MEYWMKRSKSIEGASPILSMFSLPISPYLTLCCLDQKYATRAKALVCYNYYCSHYSLRLTPRFHRIRVPSQVHPSEAFVLSEYTVGVGVGVSGWACQERPWARRRGGVGGTEGMGELSVR